MHILLTHRRVVGESQVKLRGEVLELLVNGTSTVDAFARRLLSKSTLPGEVHVLMRLRHARFCLDLGGTNIAEDSRDNKAVG